ncbi:MAG: flagellar hook capping FlgD N-terminal domain-containing protein [Spongiibacteraceae bacterium]|jgi:flagellar basal-body rod modification protein FlgD|nr:flagellar hook capping FlgD N-terminal domain-containing protein [Spongiibacteraceae bacterium]
MTIDALGSSTMMRSSDGIAGNSSDAFALRNEFLQMMVAQVRNQDPLNPLDGAEYVAQLAQFSTVESLEYLRLQERQNGVLLNTLQVLQSAQLVDKQVSVPATAVQLDSAQTLNGHVVFPSDAERVVMQVIDANGHVVAAQDWLNPATDTGFSFNLPAGAYRLAAVAHAGNAERDVVAHVQRTVEKVSLGSSSGDIRLQIEGVGNVSLFDVTEFGAAS